MWISTLGLLLLGGPAILAAPVTMPAGVVGTAPPLPVGPPQPAPTYMKNNVNNINGVAPDKGSRNGPVLDPEPSPPAPAKNGRIAAAAADDYWLSSLGPLGQSPFAPSGYQFFRNVKDFGAVGDGVTDDTAAINRAAATWGLNHLDQLRCGNECGSTTTLSAVVYFPPGTYLISSPIIQYFHSQFVGNPNNKPVIKGTYNFTGIALIDGNVYVPEGNGDNWYINQSNFFRQIRNFVFDMTGMARHNYEHDQEYVPTGIHWQVGQATSITNCDFRMAVSDAEGAATGVGIMMENGSGGSVSDLTFFGGNIGFLAGSQQFTATNLQFTSCLTAIKHVWNWGFVWKNIYVLSCWIAIDCTEFSESTNPPQGTGSITVLDSHFNGVPYAITVGRQNNQQPNIVLENLLVENSESVVLVSGGPTLLPGSGGPLFLDHWVSGYQVDVDGNGGELSGYSEVKPNKPSGLVDPRGAWYYRSKPQYENVGAGSFVVATDNGISNDGTGDQTAAINALLRNNVGSLVFFPGGVYLVRDTVFVPVGSKIVGSGWSNIMGTGSRFGDEGNPVVMVKVGNPGDSGVIEITDMLFSTKGSTPGMVLMEWNVHESSQGSAFMIDSHFRVGGGANTDLLLADCVAPQDSPKPECMAASLLLHVTPESSGFFDNVWVWVADHDLEDPSNGEGTNDPEGIPINVHTQISIYVGRGVLIESQGPTWFWGSASEHCQLYQWQILGASNLFLGHMQTETPYYQPNPTAFGPYTIGLWPSDPTFSNCDEDDGQCASAWALRIINSSDVHIYGAGFYNFFRNNELGCTAGESCQDALIETNYASRTWLYNIFTKGNAEIITPAGGLLPPVLFTDETRGGYTSEVAAYLPLSGEEAIGVDLGDGSGGGGGDFEGGSGVVYIDPEIWADPASTATVTIQCSPICVYVLPPRTLREPTTITFPLITTSLEVGWFETSTYEDEPGHTTTEEVYVSVTQTTIITVPPVTTDKIEYWNVNITSRSEEPSDSDDPAGLFTIKPTRSILPPPFTIVDDPDPEDKGTTNPPNTRTITPPPYPWPTANEEPDPDPTDEPDLPEDSDDDDDDVPVIVHKDGPPKPKCKSNCGTRCRLGIFCNMPCLLFCGGKEHVKFDFFDSNDPFRPLDPNDPDNKEKCTTSTFQSCRTNCIESATPSCTSTCSTVRGCSTTGGSWTATATPAPVYKMDWGRDEPEPESPERLLAAAQSIDRKFSASGLYDDNLPGTPGGGGGGGGGGTTTTTTRDPGPSPVPLTRGPIVCHDEADFPGHADINPGYQDDFSDDFSGLRTDEELFPGGDDTMGPNSPPIRYRRTDRYGINYDFTCEWVPGCVTTVSGQSFGFPLGSPSLITAYLLVREDYTKCNNGGVGGSCQAGCLRYTFTGGLGGLPAGCEGFDCRTCGSPFSDNRCQSCCNGRRVASFSAAGAGVGNGTDSGWVRVGNATDGWITVPEDLEPPEEEAVSGDAADTAEPESEPDVPKNGTVFVPAGEVAEGGEKGPVVVVFDDVATVSAS
ncbi:pectate lyase superfamily protein-domain-containing protein [Rhypophila decipiens]|uniref:Pectate lyase superfamily protein-domain-containing protein n=1 Tax=Rhypophila decipiens TaxID=261697 RepID=A0AAN6Y4F6_9PEZI|nr:pectate lyase superfamily protein-domain-containing protein [Rhypophila decipiens]